MLRSSCSPLGSLKAQEFMLGERVKEAEEDLSRREGRLAGQKERAERALEAKRRAHEALCLCIDEEMEEERRHARETVASRKRRAEDRKQSLEKGWNDSQETLSDIISGGAAAAKVRPPCCPRRPASLFSRLGRIPLVRGPTVHPLLPIASLLPPAS